MALNPVPRAGGQLLADALAINGTDTVFCVPGESYLAVLDGLYEHRDKVQVITCRHEAAAANMAEAYGKLTGRPGICFVTRGPGATHGSTGVHTARQDSTPMIMFVGQVGRDAAQRETFQEVDYRQMFGSLAKGVIQIEDARRVPELVGYAFQLAVAGRPGPVVVSLPEDMLTDVVQAVDSPPWQPVQAAPDASQMQQLAGLLERAERPMMIVGGSGWTEQAAQDIAGFAQAHGLPVACSFRRQDVIDNHHPCYAGDLSLAPNPALAQRVRDSDFLLVVGTRLGEASTQGFALIANPDPGKPMVHVLAGAEELGRVYRPALAINAGPAAFAAAAARLPAGDAAARAAWLGGAQAGYQQWQAVTEVPGKVNMGHIVRHVRAQVADDAIITNGAGNYAIWVHRYFSYRRRGTQLAPTCGAMGYGVPAAIAAQIVHPERQVVCFAGDGCFLMSGQELATVARYALPIIFIVVNNGMYGTIRMHQEKTYPARVIGTELTNPDFAGYARSFGLHGVTVTDTAQFAPAFDAAVRERRATLIEVQVDPQAITPAATLDQLRRQASAAH
ncbi:thiamine pyrophosphate-binding protein [Bordetella sp. BOR01]|uniref:thiamine pyrophosphate-binding protein n=1 Tax=Bordetella sp. BOR01 TaxID=2854779 RepID=UPI001C475717|nr:thiamine pyrophosphate-binding protein [Bordetella sp. BOR01]MBV7486950.1 thiamine pyrophosphate-binding protein [Bordetella sp. BOR01]